MLFRGAWATIDRELMEPHIDYRDALNMKEAKKLEMIRPLVVASIVSMNTSSPVKVVYGGKRSATKYPSGRKSPGLSLLLAY